MKRKAIIVAAVLMLSAGIVYGSGGAEKDASGPVRIGISKIVAHPALDAIEQGIIDTVKKEYPDAVFDLQNANGEASAASSIAAKFRAEGVDIAVGIATPTAQALAQGIRKVPVVFSAVTDPVDAGLVGSLEHGDGNVTGVSDMTPVREQLELLLSLCEVKRLGQVYTNSEANAVRLAELTREACNELGIEYIGTGVTNSAEVRQAAQTIAGKSDAFYISTDNTVVSAISSMIEVAADAGIPIVSADTTSAENGGVLIAMGFEQYKLGTATGEMILEILSGKEPSEMPVRFLSVKNDSDLLIDRRTASALGIEIPEEIEAVARFAGE